MPFLDKIIVSAHVVFNEIIPNPNDESFAELERLKVNVASECCNYPADYQFLVGMQHIDDENGLVYETSPQGLVTIADSKSSEETTPIHIADVTRMTATLLDTSPHPSDDSVSSVILTM